MSRFHLPLLLLSVVCSLSALVSGAEDWWEYGHFYQIYPRSFQDSDGDGIGDLNGITQRLPYLKTLNVSGVWLSPIFQSPMRDMGYDISDFTKIHREFGTMADFDQMIAKCKELDIKLILDFVPNHSSDQHEWFKASADPQDPQHYKYKDYYIWNKGRLLENGTRVPPSNWVSVFRGSVWTWVSSRKAYYLHQFLKDQPDLNFRNPAVKKEMKKVLRFWLRNGVSGFRIDAVPHIFEKAENLNELYDDEPLSGGCNDPEEYCYLKHIYTQHLDETYDLIYKWRSVMDEEEFRDHTRILMTEAYGSIPQMAGYYGKVKNGIVVKYGVQIPFNFALINIQRNAPASDFKYGIKESIAAMPKGVGIQSNWVMGNHDFSRIGSRFGPEQIDPINILIKTLPGITITYYGEEIGMLDVSELAPIDYRFPGRTPMQWDDSTNAGFSSSPKTWLPVADNYQTLNVELQKSEDESHLKLFQQLISLRQNPTIKYGAITVKTVDNVLLYKRQLVNQPDADVVIVALNLAVEVSNPLNLKSIFTDGLLPNDMEVAISSRAARIGEEVDSEVVQLESYEAIILIGRVIK